MSHVPVVKKEKNEDGDYKVTELQVRDPRLEGKAKPKIVEA